MQRKKCFAIAFLVFGFLFFLPGAVLDGLGKHFLTRIGLVSLDTLVNVFAVVLYIAIPGAGSQYLFNMRVEFETHLETVNHVLLFTSSCASNFSLLCELCCRQKSFIATYNSYSDHKEYLLLFILTSVSGLISWLFYISFVLLIVLTVYACQL